MPRPFSEPERARIRRRLLDTARSALAEGGLRRVPVERLAAAAGISKGAFYLFFPTKEALVVELLAAAEAELRARLERVLADAPPAARLSAVLRTLFAALDAHPLLRTLGDAEERAWLERALPEGAFAAARADDDAFFGALFDRLRADGLLGDAPRDALLGLPAAALALALQRDLVGADRYPAVVDLVVEGLIAHLGGVRGPGSG